MDEKTKYWIDLSEYDLKTAEVMLAGERYLYVAFMCHQAIEKILKAHYVKTLNSMPPYTHSLSHLISKCQFRETLSAEQEAFLTRLEPMNIEARYPTHKEQLFRSLSKQVCSDLLIQTRELQGWIKRQL